MTARVLNANINSSFTLSPHKGGAPGKQKKLTETASRFSYIEPRAPVNKDRHLRKDAIKEYVEKALQLHDERGGMPVVASPIWAPKTTGGK